MTSALTKIHELTDSWHVTARAVAEYSRTDCGCHQTLALPHAPTPANRGVLSHLDHSQALSPSAHLPRAGPLALLPRVVGAARLLPGVSPLHLQPKTAVLWALLSEKLHCPHNGSNLFHCPLPSAHMPSCPPSSSTKVLINPSLLRLFSAQPGIFLPKVTVLEGQEKWGGGKSSPVPWDAV